MLSLRSIDTLSGTPLLFLSALKRNSDLLDELHHRTLSLITKALSLLNATHRQQGRAAQGAAVVACGLYSLRKWHARQGTLRHAHAQSERRKTKMGKSRDMNRGQSVATVVLPEAYDTPPFHIMRYTVSYAAQVTVEAELLSAFSLCREDEDMT